MNLLKNRKTTRLKIEYETIKLNDGREVIGCITDKNDVLDVRDVDSGNITTINKTDIIDRRETYNEFEQAVLDALQLAYKVTANSLYGQTGSRFSAIYMKEIAACTTATGREMIHLAKGFMEREYGADIVYGDTDSIFCKFPLKGTTEEKLQAAINCGIKAEKAVKAVLPEYQSLAYEKVLYPLILLSKKRYIGNLYEKDPKKFKQKSMGVVLKRRDNANIVKIVYGGIIDILLNKNNLNQSVEFLREQLQNMVDGNISLDNLIVSKTLKGSYKDPTKIAHKVLADRIGERDAGNKPMINDRIPFVYIKTDGEVKLQGDRIENPEYIQEQNLVPDYYFYITNQILKPVVQLYALCLEKLPGYSLPPSYWTQIDEELSIKELYKNEKKRADRIQALKMNEVQSLLFQEYLDKLAPHKIKKARVVKETKKEVTAETFDWNLTITVKEIKRGKDYSIDCELKHLEEESVWKSTTSYKSTKLSSSIRGTEAAFVHIVNTYPDIKGMNIFADKTFIYEWKKAMRVTRSEIEEKVKNAKNDIDEVQSINATLNMMNLVDYYENISYKFHPIK